MQENMPYVDENTINMNGNCDNKEDIVVNIYEGPYINENTPDQVFTNEAMCCVLDAQDYYPQHVPYSLD